MDVFVSVLLPLAIALMMFSLGVGLTILDFKRIGHRPRAFFIGAIHQVILLPAIACALILIFGFSAETAVGIMILAACPGGITSNIVSKLANWDVALSVTLTATISLTSVITVPLILDLAMHGFIGSAAPAIDISSTAFAMFLLSAAPILLGVSLRAVAPVVAAAIEPFLSKIAMTLFATIICATIASNWNLVTDNISRLGPGLFSLVVLLTGVGFLAPRLLGCTVVEANTIAIETGVQNGTLGIGIAAIVVGGGDGFSAYAIPSAVYSIIWLLTILPALLLFRMAK